MKLYLTSYRIPTPDDLKDLLGKDFSQVKVATIANAKDYLAERARNVKISEAHKDLENLGFKPISLDLREFDNSNELKNELLKYDFIWVMGGNTFCLMHEISRSGFDKVINEILDNGVVYGGESAGACVAGNSLKGIELADNPLFSESIIWDGLSLIDKYILPHADNVAFADTTEEIREIQKNSTKLIELKDSEALIVDGPTINKVSSD